MGYGSDAKFPTRSSNGLVYHDAASRRFRCECGTVHTWMGRSQFRCPGPSASTGKHCGRVHQRGTALRRSAGVFLATLALVFVALLYPLPMKAQNFRPASQIYLPIGGHAVAGATTYATDLRVSNASADPVSVSITFVRANASDTDPHFPLQRYIPDAFRLGPFERGYEVPDGKLVELGVSGIGLLIFDGCKVGADCSTAYDMLRGKRIERGPNVLARRDISVEARIHSYASGRGPLGGTRGDSYPAIPWYMAATPDGKAAGMDHVFITGIRDDARFRTNLGFVNVSEYSSTKLIVTLFDGAGIERGQYVQPLGPLESTPPISVETMFSVLATNRFNRMPPIAGAWVNVEQSGIEPNALAAAQRDVILGCADGCPGFMAYGTMIDNTTGDAMPMEAQFDTSDRGRVGESLADYCAEHPEHPDACRGLAPGSVSKSALRLGTPAPESRDIPPCAVVARPDNLLLTDALGRTVSAPNIRVEDAQGRTVFLLTREELMHMPPEICGPTHVETVARRTEPK